MTTNDETPKLTKEEVSYLLEPKEGMDRIKILVVEDDLTTRTMYDKGLFSQIFDKKLVVSGRDAMRVYDEWHPDIIVLDIYLPEMTGYQILKEIRTIIQDRKTTIVMATQLSGMEDVRSCMELGVEGYIIKPFSLPEIGIKILGYYAKKEPERTKRADALCHEIMRQNRVRWLLDEKPKPREEPAALDRGKEAMRDKEKETDRTEEKISKD
jgi:CheY-like chemotaxis protein